MKKQTKAYVLLTLMIFGIGKTYGQLVEENADFLSWNVFAGGGIGSITEKLDMSSDWLNVDPSANGYTLNYNTKNWLLGVEWVADNGGRISISYNRRQGTYNVEGSDCHSDGEYILLDENYIQELTVRSFRICMGHCLWPGRRFSIPILWGVSFDKFKSGLLKYFYPSNIVAGLITIRPTMYVSNRLSLFVDFTGNVGFPRMGNFLSSEHMNLAPKDPGKIRHAQNEWQIMAGLSFTISNKQLIKG